MLRIVSKASSVESFIQLFRRFCDRESVFIATRTPKPIGTRTRFTINLITGEPMIAGYGEVTETYDNASSRYGRPGMRLSFVELDQQSAMVVNQLVQSETSSQRKTPLPGVPRPSAPARNGASSPLSLGEMPTEPHTVQSQAAQSQAAQSQAAQSRASQASAREARLQGSSFILPANPFGELTDESLEAFIECTMYEDTGAANEPSNRSAGNARAVTWWPPTGQSHPLPAAESSPAAGSPSPAFVPVTDSAHPHAQAAKGKRARGPQKPMHTAVIVQPRQISPWRIVAATVLLSAFVGLGVGYLLWGGSSTPEPTADDNQPAPAQAAADAAVSGDGPMGENAAAGHDAGMPTAEQDAAGAAPADSAECAIRIASKPSRAAVYVGDSLLGKTPLRTRLPCGQAELVLKRPRYGDTTELVTLTPGTRARVDVRLRRPMVTIEVSSEPSGATVVVNRKKMGQTPLSIELPAFVKSTVVIRESGYRSVRKRITPEPDEEPMHVRLSRRR